MTTEPNLSPREMRKIAFKVGFARYYSEKMRKEASEKAAVDPSKLLLLGVLPSALGFGAGYLGGRTIGNLAGETVAPGKSGLESRQYELANEATKRLIEELKARRSNQDIARALKEEEGNPQSPFAGYL